ncbi:hypothetical protein AVEN_258741-1 [Araneus ventricosus]|uniref:Uncharacterized protein n=1 Tax=Araneus ventricosus TaxID=182803 RepID=A0A4Y2D3J2_ARAVE|nr:hypothetical protein AVEN_258741-1 [Araneus ventricosus]
MHVSETSLYVKRLTTGIVTQSDQETFFQSSLVQPIFSRAQQRYSSRWRVVSKDTQVGLLLSYHINAKFRCTVLTDTSVLRCTLLLFDAVLLVC